MTAAVQARLDLVALENGVACFGTRPPTHAVGLLDVVGAEAALASADDAIQEEILAGRAQFLNAQTTPFQILVRAEPVDLEAHLRRVQARAELLPEALRAIALDYIGFLRTLAQQRTLLERHCYVVLPDQQAEVPAVSLSRRLRGFLIKRAPGGHADDPEAVPSSVARRLQAHSDLVARQLGRSGLRTRRLDSQQVAELLHRCWSPGLARVQRLREELAAYTTLVVGSRRLATPAPAGRDTAQTEMPSGGAEVERLFALGTRRLADLIAPSGCEVRADYLRLDGHYARVLVVTGYPRLVTPGWLSLLVETDLPIEASLHVVPLASTEMVRALGVQIARLQSSRLAALRGERVADPERDLALEDAERLRERLQRGEERLFAVSLYLLLRAKALRELDDLTRRVEEQLDALLAHSRRALWEQERGFRSCLPEARDQLLVPRNLDTSALAATLPFVGPSLAMENGMLVGLARVSQTPVLLDPFDRSLDNANLVVVAPAGAGKSFFCKLLMLRQLINGTDAIAIDPENEYGRVAEAADGQVVRLAASSAHHLNPFDLPPPAVDRAGTDGKPEENPLAEHVREVVTPRTNAARLSSAEHLFGTLVPGGGRSPEPVSLEIVGDAEQRRFLVRATSADALWRVAGQLGAAYPQAALRPFDAATFPLGDPLQVGPDEQLATATLRLGSGEHLPLRTFDDRDLDAGEAGRQVDPLLAILGSLADLPRGWRAVAQLIVLGPAPRDWARAYQRLALERPLEQERRSDTGPSLVGPLALLGLIGLYLAGSSAGEAWERGEWPQVLGLAAAAVVVLFGAILVVHWLRNRELVDPRLVQAKLSRSACVIELRLAIVAPSFIEPDAVQARLDRLAAAYRPFALATGNALVPRSVRGGAPSDLRVLAPPSGDRPC